MPKGFRRARPRNDETLMASLIAATEKTITNLRRKRVSRQVFELNGGHARCGPFKGPIFGTRAHKSAGNLGRKPAVCK